ARACGRQADARGERLPGRDLDLAQRPARERQEHHGRDDARRRQGLESDARGRRRRRRRGARRAHQAHRGQVRRRGMNFVLHGYPVSGGITVGYAHLVSTARLEVAHYEVDADAVDAEVERFDQAMRGAQAELQALKEHIPPGSPKEFEAFLDLHRMILNDSALAQVPRELIRSRRYNAEWALVQQMERLAERFEEIEDPYLRERKADVEHAVERVLKSLMGTEPAPEPPISEEEKLIVVAHDLSPADMILFKRHRYGGFVTDVGGVTSHTAIVARSLGIPALVGLHHAYQTISEGELLIVDGVQGLLVVNPDAGVLAEYRKRQTQVK